MAKAQYPDLKGKSSVQLEGQPYDFEKMCSDLNVDLEKYTPVGIRVGLGANYLPYLSYIFVVLKDDLENPNRKILAYSCNFSFEYLNAYISDFEIDASISGFEKESYSDFKTIETLISDE